MFFDFTTVEYYIFAFYSHFWIISLVAVRISILSVGCAIFNIAFLLKVMSYVSHKLGAHQHINVYIFVDITKKKRGI